MFVSVDTTTIWVVATPRGTGDYTHAHKFKALLTKMALWESVTIGTKIGGIEGALLRDGDDLYRIPRVWSWVLHSESEIAVVF